MIYLQCLQRPNPADKTADRKFYVSTKSAGDVSLEEMSEAISDRCTLTETDVLAALSALQHEMIKNLRAGKIVRFGSFGSFQFTLKSSGVDSVEETSQKQVKSVHVKFRPGARITTGLKTVKYSLKTVDV